MVQANDELMWKSDVFLIDKRESVTCAGDSAAPRSPLWYYGIYYGFAAYVGQSPMKYWSL